MTKHQKIITVFNEKGGSGKTTLSCQLANTLALRGFAVQLVDLDPQGTATHWASAGAEGAFKPKVWPAAQFTGAKVTEEIGKDIANWDFIVADCAPSVDQPSTWAMLLVSDLALIPTRLSPPDLSALRTAKRLVAKVQEEVALSAAPRKFPFRVVANGVRMHLDEDRDYLALLAEDSNVPPMAATLGDRRAYQRSMLRGSSVHKVPDAKDSVREVEALTDEVLSVLKIRVKTGGR